MLPAAEPAGGGVVRVTDFRAVGDGKTDRTKAFRQAIEAVAGVSNGATVIVPQGR